MIKQFIKSSLKCFKKCRERRKRKAHKVENGYRESIARATFLAPSKVAKFGIKFDVHEVFEKWQSAGANILAPGKVSKFVMKLVIMIKFQYLSILDKLYFARV